MNVDYGAGPLYRGDLGKGELPWKLTGTDWPEDGHAPLAVQLWPWRQEWYEPIEDEL
jgi:hypothetical protein